MTNLNEKSTWELISYITICALGMFIFFCILSILSDMDNKNWHKDNDICNLTCLHALKSNQHLNKYSLIHRDIIIQSYDRICNCAIRECTTDDCSIYETKNIFVNDSIVK